MTDNGDITQELQREQRFGDIRQAGFKRRCAYYAMMVLAGIVAKAATSDPDIGKNVAELFQTISWTCGFVIMGAMGVEGWQTYTNMKAGKP